MKHSLLLYAAIAVAFCSGFVLHAVTSTSTQPDDTRGRVTGIGGIFFKCKDPKTVREWYATHLGLQVNKYGAVFEWRQGADSSKKGFSQWSPFKETTKYFEPSTKEFMINYRVTHLDALVDALRKDGVTIADTIARYDYGAFVHIMDCEGNKIELWEPNDVEYERMGLQMGSTTTK